MDNKELHEWAIKGISAEMIKIDKNIKEGYGYLNALSKGEKILINKTADEIRLIVEEYEKEFDRLDKLLFKLKWQ